MSTDPAPEDRRSAEPYRSKKLFWWEWVIKTLALMGMVYWFITLDDTGQSLATVAGWTMVASLLIPIAVVAVIWRGLDVLSRRLQGLPTRPEAILRSQWRWRWSSVVLFTGLSILWTWLFILHREAPQIAAALLTALGALWTALDLRRLRHRQVPDQQVYPEGRAVQQ